MAYSVFYCEIYSMFYLLLALEYCCSFHLLATLLPAFDLHGLFLSFLTLPFSIQCVPKIPWIFLSRLNALSQ